MHAVCPFLQLGVTFTSPISELLVAYVARSFVDLAGCDMSASEMSLIQAPC